MDKNETKRGIIHACLKEFPGAYYDLIFTNSRIVFVKTNPSDIWNLFGVFGVIGIVIDILTLINKRKRRKKQIGLIDKPVEDILKLSEDNFFVPFSEIKSIKMNKYKLEIVTTKDTKSFQLCGYKNAVVSRDKSCEYEKIIRNAVPEALIQECVPLL